MTYILTEPAERDLRSILRQTLRMFGPRQVQNYGALIRLAMQLVGADPNRAGSIDRSTMGSGVRLLPIGLAARRQGAASHCLYYARGKSPDGSDATIILRILHEKMEPRHRVARALVAFGEQTPLDPQEEDGSGE